MLHDTSVLTPARQIGIGLPTPERWKAELTAFTPLSLVTITLI